MYSFTGILELDDSDDCVEPTQERQLICNDGVPSGCCLCQVGEVGISRGKCRHCLDVGRRPVYHTTFACSFCKVRLCNVFPEAMETQVVRVQLDRTLQFQSIPPLLPAYNKYMGGVDRLSQVRKT